ncbi:MAG: D-alanyl-D-alanine carboxypeptidase [Gammaproteobacteria bacterium]|nr:D-alanyl-D-alanine carboxypeptidase [Gammaproteobacteria bacterium]
MKFVFNFAQIKRQLLFILMLIPALSGAYPSRYAAVILDYRTGHVLHAINPNAPRYPASLTKMMTLYMVFDALETGRLSLNQALPVSQHAASREPSKLGLRAGQTITVRNAILAMVTHSANDVATVVAEALGQGSERRFGRLMTRRAHQIGMVNSSFCNASGLPEPCQVSTAYDMAKLARAIIITYPQYYHYFQIRQFAYRGAIYGSHNHMLGRYPGVDGLKTGFCRASGFNIATSMKRGGTRLVGVVMGLPSAHARDTHMARLLNNTFQLYPSLAAAE